MIYFYVAAANHLVFPLASFSPYLSHHKAIVKFSDRIVKLMSIYSHILVTPQFSLSPGTGS